MVTKPNYERTPGNRCQASPPSTTDLYGVLRSKDGKSKRCKTSGRTIPHKTTDNGFIRADAKIIGTMKATKIWEELCTKRKIRVKAGLDILFWGHMPNGTYSTKEAYNILHQQNPSPTDPIWKNIWKANLWPKITTLLWFLNK